MSAPFSPVYLREPFPLGYDPVIFPGGQFGDGQHRVLVMFSGAGKRTLYKTSDFSTFTTVLDDWVSSEPSDGANTFQDAVVLDDGTFVLYQNDGSEGTTAVWTGTAADIDAGTITRQGRVLSSGGDCGAFYESPTDLIHIYTEDPTNPFGSVSSDRLLHFTTPADDLLNATQRADAINTGGTWGTGDPDIIEYGGQFWLFTDYTEGHPTYWVALYRSDDLDTWELIDSKFTEVDGTRGGDFDVIDVGDHLIAMSEYTGSGGGDIGVGVWQLDKEPFKRTRLTVGGSKRRTWIGSSRAELLLWPSN